MSKPTKRKITVDPAAKPEAARPSVFERLGTKKAAGKKPAGAEREHCRQWAAHGVCAYGKGCKFAATHTLVSPSKARAASKEDGGGARLHSAVVRADELDTWDQSDLEYADTDVLEKRRQQLQRELELQLKMESGKKKKLATSSSSSRSSSTSSATSSSSAGSSSSSSSGRDRKKIKKGKLKRNSSSSSDRDSPAKKKKLNKDSAVRGKVVAGKKPTGKKDDRPIKKLDPNIAKKKVMLKMNLTKKSMSPGKKTSGTPPIGKGSAKIYPRKQSKSPLRREKNRSLSPRDKERERQREREKEREKERERGRAKSRSVQRKARSRTPRRSREPARRKDSSERSRPLSPKKPRRDVSPEKHRKSPTRDRDRKDHKERSLDRRKDEKDRHERDKLLARQRERDRPKDKRDTSKRGGRDRREPDRGLEKPSKPMERLLPRPEERMAALAAISNRNVEPDKSSTTSKDRQDSERGRKQERMDRDRRERSSKRDRMSLDRDHGEYDHGLERGYDRGHSLERGYDRERYDDPREGDVRSPGYGRERHYDPGYDIPGHPRYVDEEVRSYGDRMGDHRDIGFDDRRRRDHSWDGSVERERPYHGHPHKEWEGEEFHPGGEWGRERHWQHRDQQVGDWAEKDGDLEPAWHHRGHPPPAPHRPRVHDESYNRGRMELREQSKRRPGPRPEPEPAKEAPPAAAELPDEPPAPDDLSEISDDPDDILNRDDMVERSDAESQPERAASEERDKPEAVEAATNHAQEAAAPSPPATSKVDGADGKEDDDMKGLDFEEISDGELEEERTKAGLGDALGVDWGSLVAEVRRSARPAAAAGARDRWRPETVLTRLGLSVATDPAAEGSSEEPADSDKLPPHPVASIQVALERRQRQRAALFGSGCDVTRALSARRDLALRRHLCNLPPTERGAAARGGTQPQLFNAARALLMQSG